MSIEITMPRLSDTMEQGTILKWNVAEGDAVASGTVVADIETDKATMEMQVYDDGVIARVLVTEGTTVEVGTPIAILAEDDEDPKKVASSYKAAAATKTPTAESGKAEAVKTDEAPAAKEAAPAAGATATSATPAAGDNGAAATGDEGCGARLRISPVARRMAEEHAIPLRSIHGSGPHGRIVKRDVQDAIAAGPATGGAATGAPTMMPLPGSTLTAETAPLSSMRQTIARRLVESKTTIPHYQVTMRFDMDPLLALRATLNEQLAAQGVKLSVNDFLVRACALAMHQHRAFNASFGGDSIRYHADVNIGIAIALPPERGGGLVVGTVRQTDRIGLRQISAESKRLAEAARTRGLSPQDMSDSTFTISNLGMFGVDHFTAIINPPNAAILAVGAAMAVPVVRDGAVVVGHEMSATLSLDHRVIDGAMAAQYLQTVKHYIEHPATLLV
ncbi:MAG: 2-oxo acid dehydrogenase subunit E2 [Phycisphaerales bacterium]|nr:2-oxo acid dehydrogenase subunit E2 [Phycisphaerales bacterium]